MLLLFVGIVLLTLVVIGIRRRRGQPILVPSLILGVVVLSGLMMLVMYIQTLLLVILAVVALVFALRWKK